MAEKLKKKQLQKIVKGQRKEIKRLNFVESELRRQIKVWEERKISWKQQFDAEVYYKNQAVKTIAALEAKLNSLGYKSDEHGYIGEMPSNLNMGVDGQLRDILDMSQEEVVEAAKTRERVTYEDKEYILQEAVADEGDTGFKTILDPELGTGNKFVQVNTGDCVGHQPFDEPTNGISELRSVKDLTQDEAHSAFCNQTLVIHQGVECIIVSFESHPNDVGFDVIVESGPHVQEKVTVVKEETGYKSNGGEVIFDLTEAEAKQEDNEAVAWAKRNGHHFPNGIPGKDRSTSVVVKHPEEISQENRNLGNKLAKQMLIDETNAAIAQDMEDNPQDYPMKL